MFETRKTKQNKQAKDKRSAEKTMGFMPTDYKTKVRQLMLYLPSSGIEWVQLADRTYVLKSKSGSLFKIRFTRFASPMLQLQYKQRGNGSRLLRKNVKGDRKKRNGQTPKRQASKRKSSRPLSKVNSRVPRTTK